MKNFFLTHADSVRGFLAGFLVVLSLFIFQELISSAVHVVIALFGIALAVWLAQKTEHHFHGGHTHGGDSAFDVVGPALLIVINVLHPAVDGFSLYETFTNVGRTAGIIALIGIALHETIRQWALIEALAKMNVRRARVIVMTALFGLLLGVSFGVLGTKFLHESESVIDIATLFAYAFIIAEFWHGEHGTQSHGKHKWGVVLLGIVVGVVYGVVF